MKKIPTLFERRFEGHKVVDVLPIITPGCAEAFAHGIATVKYDGACCAVFDGVLYKRYDAKAGKRIPDGAIPCQPLPDPVTGHFPCWVKCNKDNPADNLNRFFCIGCGAEIDREGNFRKMEIEFFELNGDWLTHDIKVE